MSSWQPTHDEAVLTRQETQKPPMYRVLLHNDDFTTQQFVIMILQEIFHHSHADAMNIMLAVHNKGIGIAGVYTREVAETKIDKVHSLAADNNFPLRCSMQPDG